MTSVVGVICEYDPFHAGHARQFSFIREKLPGAKIVCAMSGCFTQRGMPALYSPAFRAKAALMAGADLVLELPTLFSVQHAEAFALGGVSLFHQLGFVTHLSFGCENENLLLLKSAAALLTQPDERFSALLKAQLDIGRSFAAAQGAALTAWHEAIEPSTPQAELASFFSAPNNILAICYLRALLRLGSPIQPLPVLRVGAYHAQSLESDAFPSATAVRAALLSGSFVQAEAACGYPLPRSPMCLPTALDSVLLARLRQMSREALLCLPDCSEGLENLLLQASRDAVSRESLLSLLKSKRYTRARLSRLLCHALLGITHDLQKSHGTVPYARLLGFRKESSSLLHALRRAELPIIAKAARGPLSHPAYQLDQNVYDLWALGAEVPAGLMFRQPVQIV